jgi:hypothetical protein
MRWWLLVIGVLVIGAFAIPGLLLVWGKGRDVTNETPYFEKSLDLSKQKNV